MFCLWNRIFLRYFTSLFLVVTTTTPPTTTTTTNANPALQTTPAGSHLHEPIISEKSGGGQIGSEPTVRPVSSLSYIIFFIQPYIFTHSEYRESTICKKDVVISPCLKYKYRKFPFVTFRDLRWPQRPFFVPDSYSTEKRRLVFKNVFQPN